MFNIQQIILLQNLSPTEIMIFQLFCLSVKRCRGSSTRTYSLLELSLNRIRVCCPSRVMLSTTNVYKSKNLEKNEYFFGSEKVSPSDKRRKVQSVFTNVAPKYDVMNDIMSCGIHRLWKDYFIHTLSPMPGTKLLDVAGGTGDIALRFLQACSQENQTGINTLSQFEAENNNSFDYEVVVLDMNDKMLSICKQRAEEAGFHKALTCIQGNAEVLPFPDNYFDAYTIAFGIRNVVHIKKALSEARRVLKPGGRFLCLEFSEVQRPLLNRLYCWYSQEIIPVLGQIIAGDWKSYQYLVESIEKFPNQEEFSSMIDDVGFNVITHENLLDGIAAIHSAYKL